MIGDADVDDLTDGYVGIHRLGKKEKKRKKKGKKKRKKKKKEKKTKLLDCFDQRRIRRVEKPWKKKRTPETMSRTRFERITFRFPKLESNALPLRQRPFLVGAAARSRG